MVLGEAVQGRLMAAYGLLGTPKAHKHKHFMGISLPYWALIEGGLYGISLSSFLLIYFFGALLMGASSLGVFIGS